jgi:vitamin K-dependent gamma-carboxylase
MTATEDRQVDGASLAALRALFGLIMLIAVVRFFAHGWIDSYFYEPRHFFHADGFSWVKPWPRPWMHVHFAVMGVAAVLVMVGYWHRVAAVVLGALFAYAYLCDLTNYLNHAYLLVQVSFLLAILPAGERVPVWALWAARAQIGLVYFFGGVAKLSPDWLLHGQPLTTWLQANADVPVVGILFAKPWFGVAASWGAAGFDLTIVGWLLWRRSRPFAYVVVCAFHLMTWRLFHLGMFPWAMTAFATVFFAPDWPRRLLGRFMPALRVETPGVRIVPMVIAVHLVLQVLLPLRAFLYGGDPLWHEQGFRLAWKVMLMEKTGVAELRVREPATGRTWRVPASTYYTRYQAGMMATQPDLILQAAHVAAADFRSRGVAHPEVFVDAFVSLNGRPRRQLIDPYVNLAAVDDGFAPKRWILPAPDEPPP